VDSGAVPQTSKRAGSRAGGGGVKPPDSKGNGSAKANGNGSSRQGPVDPRTEDTSSPQGISRGAKTIWRRPGASTSRSAKRDTVEPAAPSDFAMTLPLAPAPFAIPAAKAGEPVADITEAVEPAVVQPTIEVVQPTPWALGVVPTMLVPTAPVPKEVEPVDEPDTEAMPELIPAPILYDEAATIDDVTMIGPVLETRPLHRPIRFRRAPKPRVRRVTRVVRHVDTWSVFKVALVFNVFFYAVALVAGVLLWQVAYATGTIDNVEKFFEGFGWETFQFNGGQIFHNAWIAGLFVAVGFTGLAVLLATLFNLITDLVGGVRFSVLEEEVQTRVQRGTAPVMVEPVEPVEPVFVPAEPDLVETVAEPVAVDDEPTEAIAG
jgi:hypothetical protein